jgi:hypothetical protein
VTTDLSGAIRTGGDFKKTVLKLGYGAHKAYFTGLGPTEIEQSNFPCKVCKGSGAKQDAQCFTCNGTGKKTTTKVPILYQIGPNSIQEEWVTFAVTEPGKMQDGTPKSASTLWVRLKALSGLSAPADINAWYIALPTPIKIPVEIMVVDADNGNGHVIASVKPVSAQTAKPEPVQAAEEEPLFDELDDSIPF